MKYIIILLSVSILIQENILFSVTRNDIKWAYSVDSKYYKIDDGLHNIHVFKTRDPFWNCRVTVTMIEPLGKRWLECYTKDNIKYIGIPLLCNNKSSFPKEASMHVCDLHRNNKDICHDLTLKCDKN